MTDLRSGLQSNIAYIRDTTKEIGDLPAQVDGFSGDIVTWIRVDGYSKFPNPFAIERAVDRVWENRDRINQAIRESWNTLVELDPELEVPVRLIGFADEWRNIQGDLTAAQTNFNETNLSAEWQGDAASRYVEMRSRQQTALVSMQDVCGQIAVNLEDVANAQLTLYTELATKSQELVERVTEVAGSFIASMFDLPRGAISAQADLLTAVEASKSFILGTVTSMATSAQSLIISGNRIAQTLSIQRGLPNNHWPPGVKESYGTGIDGIRIAIGDGAASDGDKSDWELGATKVVTE
ncbi:hypothetical protein [Nocardia harenae]|uniref:hypothetical protein n=1 Tax=Nocardia harenae TaxID=358707 RepID=UPI00082A7F20|nr:hypothetical protein [Nocardia harenae]